MENIFSRVPYDLKEISLKVNEKINKLIVNKKKHGYLKIEMIYYIVSKKLYFVKKKRRKMNEKEVLKCQSHTDCHMVYCHSMFT